MGVRRRLEALTDNSSKFRDHRKHLSPSTITPTLTITLLKYPYPNLNLILIQKLKLCVYLDSFSDLRGLGINSMSCRVPKHDVTGILTYRCLAMSTLSTHTMLNVRELMAIGNRGNLETKPTNVVQDDGYKIPAGYRVQHVFLPFERYLLDVRIENL